jgi:iron complex transport system permease protein
VLGVSGGAALAALAALALGASLVTMQLAAAAGALAALALLFALAGRALLAQQATAYGDEATTRLLLAGVMIAALCAALIALVLTLAPEAQLRPMLFWLLGDLSAATDLRQALVALTLLAVALWLAARRARALDLLLRGDSQAQTQGVAVARTRRALVLIAALATGAAVLLAGAVGFVGFVAPHLLRLAIGNAQRTLLPAAALAGGLLVLAADTVARTAFAPLQLPVGVVTALIGAPAFLWLLTRRGRW